MPTDTAGKVFRQFAKKGIQDKSSARILNTRSPWHVRQFIVGTGNHWVEVIAVANERVLHVVDDMTHADETSKKSKRNKGFATYFVLLQWQRGIRGR